MISLVSVSNKRSRHTNLAMPDAAQQVQLPAQKRTTLTIGSSTASCQAESLFSNILLLPLVRNPIDGAKDKGR
jgi:hypothetical protein